MKTEALRSGDTGCNVGMAWDDKKWSVGLSLETTWL